MSTQQISAALPIGVFFRFRKGALQGLIDALLQLGYRVVGPSVRDGAVIYEQLTDVERLPRGLIDRQDGGSYRLEPSGRDGWFDYVVGPHSLKNFLFPPRDTVLECHRLDDRWELRVVDPVAEKLAVIGVRSCDLHALAMQDRIFLQGEVVDRGYELRRRNLFTVGINCRRAAATCFCHSLQTGPALSARFDLGLTELDEDFVVEVGSQSGAELAASLDWEPCPPDQVEQGRQQSRQLAQQMHSASPAGPRQRQLDTHDLRDLLMDNLDHPRWAETAERCLACANCTLVCPTCFCSTVTEVSDLSGDHVQRQRSWASCFTAEHSYLSSGTVRKSVASRYRQWLTHKLATWIDQFGASGCVGCGRCITWCPVGIDLTEEVAAIRGVEP